MSQDNKDVEIQVLKEIRPVDKLRIQTYIRNGLNSRKTALQVGMAETSFCNWKKQEHIQEYLKDQIEEFKEITLRGTTIIGSKTTEMALIEIREKEIYQKDPVKYIKYFREHEKPHPKLTNIFHVNLNTQNKMNVQIKTPNYDKVFALMKASQQQINFNQEISNNNEMSKETGMIAVPYEIQDIKEMQKLLDVNAKRVDEKIKQTEDEFKRREKEFNKAD